MMEKIQFDSGVREYKINGMGVLRFNPGDPNLYARFMEAAEKIDALQKELSRQSETEGTGVLHLLQTADQKMKALLGWVFGEGNDFDKLLGGVNLLAVAGNGERVVTNLFEALQPILLSGVEAVTREKTAQAVAKAKANRAAR